MTTKPRVNRLAAQAKKRHEAARAEYRSWWNQFSNADLEKILTGDKAALARCQALGYERIEKIARYALTPEEKKELKKIEKEFMRRGNESTNQKVTQACTIQAESE